jgi:hypothetical protein
VQIVLARALSGTTPKPRRLSAGGSLGHASAHIRKRSFEFGATANRRQNGTRAAFREIPGKPVKIRPLRGESRERNGLCHKTTIEMLTTRARTWITAVTGVVSLVVVLALVDYRVRDEISRLANGRPPSSEVMAAGEEAQNLTYIVVRAVRDQSIEHAPLTIFGLSALVLVLLMLRT